MDGQYHVTAHDRLTQPDETLFASGRAQMSFIDLIKGIRTVGVRQWFRDLNYIGTVKVGDFKGADQFGNKYYENLDEIPGRHRWVEFVQHDFNASQVPPEWHSWLSHIRALPPIEDPVMIASHQKWQLPHRENVTGTRGAFKTYSTTAPKISAWTPKIAERKA